MARRAWIISRSLRPGASHLTLKRRSLWPLTWVPSPRMNRPFDDACRSQAVCARIIGLLGKATAMAVPRLRVRVAVAATASGMNGSCWASALHKASNPISSAAWASAATSANELTARVVSSFMRPPLMHEAVLLAQHGFGIVPQYRQVESHPTRPAFFKQEKRSQHQARNKAPDVGPPRDSDQTLSRGGEGGHTGEQLQQRPQQQITHCRHPHDPEREDQRDQGEHTSSGIKHKIRTGYGSNGTAGTDHRRA